MYPVYVCIIGCVRQAGDSPLGNKNIKEALTIGHEILVSKTRILHRSANWPERVAKEAIEITLAKNKNIKPGRWSLC